MSEAPDGSKGLRVALIAIATTIAGYVPSTYVYESVTRTLWPAQHAEEALGRGIEVLLIGGPACTLAAAIAAGLIIHRSKSKFAVRIAGAFIVASAIASIVLVR